MNPKEEDICKLMININEKKPKRNYGIDLLKIIAMINVINLHINQSSGLLKLNPKDIKFRKIYLLEIFSFWPVDAFGLISGLIGFKKYKFSNLIYLWFEYFYYSTFFSLYLYIKSNLDLKQLFLSCFPIGINRLWYVNAYFFMYLLLPFITNSTSLLNIKKYTKLIAFIFFMYSFYYIFMKYILGKANYHFARKGYSTIWIIQLYIAGSYIGRFFMNKPFLPKTILFVLYICSSFFAYGFMLYNYKKTRHVSSLFEDYLSPTTIIQSLSLLLLFSDFDINNKYLIKVLLFLNPLNFNVTLIHMRIFSFQTPIVKKFFKYIRKLGPKYIFFKIYGISSIIYFICSFFDYFRHILFKILKIRSLSIYIEKYLFE